MAEHSESSAASGGRRSSWEHARDAIASAWFRGALVLLGLPFALAEYSTLALRHAGKATEARLELTELIEKVKLELVAAEDDRLRKGETPFFLLQGVDLEVNFVVETKAGGEVKLIAVSGTTETALSKTQRVTVHLNPAPAHTIVVPASAPQPIASGAKLIGPLPPSLPEERK